MKIKVWTFLSSNDCGENVSVHSDAISAYGDWLDCLRSANLALDAWIEVERIASSHDWASLVTLTNRLTAQLGWCDSYQVEAHEIELQPTRCDEPVDTLAHVAELQVYFWAALGLLESQVGFDIESSIDLSLHDLASLQVACRA